MRPPVNVSSMLFSARLSTAETPNASPFAMSCVSDPVTVKVIAGSVTSRWMPPGFRVVSHAQMASARALIPHSAVPRVITRISSPGLYRPARPRGLLARGRDEIVDDVWRDQNQEIAPVLRLGREPKQLAQNRQIYKKRYSGLGYRDLSHRKSANYSRFAVVDQDLVVRLLRLERESDVDRRRPHVGAFGVHFHQDLAVRRDVRRDTEIDTGLLELDGGARHRLARST